MVAFSQLHGPVPAGLCFLGREFNVSGTIYLLLCALQEASETFKPREGHADIRRGNMEVRGGRDEFFDCTG